MQQAILDKWEAYNQLRVAGVKKQANQLLAEFISTLQQQDPKAISEFVNMVCMAVLETNHEIVANNGWRVSEMDTRIQHPLFKEIIVPELIQQYLQHSAMHIKWIGQLEQFFYADTATATHFLQAIQVEGFFSAFFFFEKSFALQPNQQTLSLLLSSLAQPLDYYMHEVPHAVLVHPDELTQALAVFKNYFQQVDNKAEWAQALQHWELIATHWSIYFSQKDGYENFEVYLQANGVVL
ncbi:MAG TPA: hypothetical protein VLC98_09180 [Phnomibacter sp.]|nr:hypothetical protein [Phnomibacter sp.]